MFKVVTMPNNEFICPLCQQSNRCGINSSEPCWCFSSKIPEDLIKQVPTEYKNKSCICKCCVDKFNQLSDEIT